MRVLVKISIHLLLVLVVVGMWPAKAFAWGSKGHQIIAHIATGRLSASARNSIDELLGPGETLVTVSTWADQQRDETADWHSVAIPLRDSYYSRTKDCPRDKTCIIDAIAQQIAILKTSSNAEERAQALRYVVHLVGDLHQPFHVTTNTNPPDFGANKVPVKTLGGRRTNLHSVWDTDLVEYGSRNSKSVSDYAEELSSRFRMGMTSQGVTQKISTQGSITDWALEAHKLSWSAYYHTNKEFMVNEAPREWTLDQEYYDKNVPLVELQLMQAGARLARILNEAFGSRAT